MKHPRLKAKTIRVTLGFLILSLWRRPSSRAESWVRGSCEVDAVLVVSPPVSTLSPTGASIRLADPCGSLSSCTSSAVQCGSRSGDEGKDRKKRARLNTCLLRRVCLTVTAGSQRRSRFTQTGTGCLAVGAARAEATGLFV